MTEDVHVPNSMSEYNRNVPSEKPQLQVTDIIDQIANSVEGFPYETTQPEPLLLFMPEKQEGVNHLIENTVYETGDVEASEVSAGVKEDQGKPEGNKEQKAVNSSQETRDLEEEAGEGTCEETHPVTTKEQEAIKKKERNVQSLQDEEVCNTNQAEEEPEEEVQLNETKEQMKEETQLEATENATEEESEERAQKENCKDSDSHKKGQEANSKEFLPTSPQCNSQTEQPDEQPGTLRKSDISRHSYSRYNTISYRKIRKGNTKQRIDEFESMMHS
uniref:Ermin n=1 Tax=Pogona vitticeps TaxID=103695 RepID=A0A6J0UFC5_9SAUR